MQVNNALVDNFIAVTNWETVWEEGCFSQGNTEPIERNLDPKVLDIWGSGVTKLVLRPTDPTANYVIKIPFLYLYDEDYDAWDEDEACGDPYIELQRAPHPKAGVSRYGFNSEDWNYCETEMEYCDLAADAGLSQFFPETIKYCETPFPIYLQETCYPSYSRKDVIKHTNLQLTRDEFFNELEEKYTYEVANWCYIFSASWLLDAITWYGKQMVGKLFEFMTCYHMKDFHGDNYGYRESDNSPVLIDFAGFYEE